MAPELTPVGARPAGRALRAHHVHPGRRLGHRQLRPVGRRARQAAGPAGRPGHRRRRRRPRRPGRLDPGADRLLPEAATTHERLGEPAARPRGPAAPAHRRAVRAGALRRHRRPVAQEGDAGDLRPRQPRPAAAGLQPDRLRPPRLGRRGLRPGRARLRQGARPHRVPRGGLEAARRGVPLRAGQLRRRHRRSTPCAAPSRSSTRCAAPAATTPSTSRSRRASSATSSASSRSTGSPSRRRGSWRRVVVEKPFGHDVESARELNATLAEVFPSGSIFRIDHYLGKETVQNILALRFANAMFEPIWNSNYVDHVQITMAEDIGIGGRAGYYDGIGAARDVIQNHLMQLMSLVAMEEPTSFDAEDLRIEKLKLLSAVEPAPPARPDHRARAVRRGLAGRREGRRLPRGGGRPQDLGHRDVRRGDPARGQPALGGRAVLPAHRQAARPPRHRGRDRLQAGAAPAVQPRTRPRSSPTTRW